MPAIPNVSKAQQKAIQKADTLIEALGWIRKFREVPAMGADGEMARGRRDTSNRRRRES